MLRSRDQALCRQTGRLQAPFPPVPAPPYVPFEHQNQGPSQAWWRTPGIPAAWEVEVGGSQVQDQRSVSHLVRPVSETKRAGDVAQPGYPCSIPTPDQTKPRPGTSTWGQRQGAPFHPAVQRGAAWELGETWAQSLQRGASVCPPLKRASRLSWAHPRGLLCTQFWAPCSSSREESVLSTSHILGALDMLSSLVLQAVPTTPSFPGMGRGAESRSEGTEQRGTLDGCHRQHFVSEQISAPGSLGGGGAAPFSLLRAQCAQRGTPVCPIN